MANGQQLAQENIKKFQSWVSERRATGDWQDYIRNKNQINRTEIARECAFAASVLRQNPAIKASLFALEEELRKNGTLVRPNLKSAEIASERRSANASSRDQQRIKALEEKTAAQAAKIQALESTLKRYKLFDDHLCETGRALKP